MKTTIKKIALMTLFIGISSVLLSNVTGQTALNNEPFSTHSFSYPIQSVEVATTNGSITIAGNNSSDVLVEMFIYENRPRSARRRNRINHEDISRILEEEYTIDIRVEGGKLFAVARPKNQLARQRLSISFRISVPTEVNSDVQTSNASVRIRNLAGVHNLRTSNGSVTIENVSGKITGRTSNGSITVANSNDEIDLTTSNGSITARDLQGSITLRTSNGAVRMNNLNGTVSATTSNGGVTANNINGGLRVATSNGGVRLDNVSGNVNARTSNSAMNVTMASVNDYVILATSNGAVNLSLPAEQNYDLNVRAERVQTNGLTNFSGQIDNRHLVGRTGNGETRVDVSTTSGRANLRFR
jgi:DUF4097 and DUF4098 domain-containing protein YvlB